MYLHSATKYTASLRLVFWQHSWKQMYKISRIHCKLIRRTCLLDLTDAVRRTEIFGF